MNRTQALRALLGALVVVALTAAGCSDSSPQPASDRTPDSSAAPATAAGVTMVENGYPLGRSLRALVNVPDVDSIVVVTNVTPGEPRWIGAPGGAGPDSPGSWIVTPAEATVSRVFRGAAKVGDTIQLAFSGGRVGEYEAVSTDETSAQLPEVAKYSRLVLGGAMTADADGSGLSLEPHFVYGVGDDDVARSLLESVGEIKRPSFSIPSLRDAELAR